MILSEDQENFTGDREGVPLIDEHLIEDRDPASDYEAQIEEQLSSVKCEGDPISKNVMELPKSRENETEAPEISVKSGNTNKHSVVEDLNLLSLCK